MKTFLLTGFLMVVSAAAFAQGQVIFANNSTTLITNTCTGLPCAGGPNQDDTQVGLYAGVVGDNVNSLNLISTPTNCFAPGRFSGGTLTIGFDVGPVQLQVRAWLADTVYPSYEAALAAMVGGDVSANIGASAPFSFALTAPPTVPHSIAGNGLTPFWFGRLTCIPEPSTLALGLLGLGVLCLFLRRK